MAYRTRYAGSAPRRVYYDYGQRSGRSFWQKHRDKLTVAMGTGGGALLGLPPALSRARDDRPARRSRRPLRLRHRVGLRAPRARCLRRLLDDLIRGETIPPG